MELCVAPVAEHKAKQIGLWPVRRTLSSRNVSVYPCATHGPDGVCAATAIADRATHLASTQGEKDVGNGKYKANAPCVKIVGITGAAYVLWSSFKNNLQA